MFFSSWNIISNFDFIHSGTDQKSCVDMLDILNTASFPVTLRNNLFRRTLSNLHATSTITDNQRIQTCFQLTLRLWYKNLVSQKTPSMMSLWMVEFVSLRSWVTRHFVFQVVTSTIFKILKEKMTFHPASQDSKGHL